MGRVKRGVGWGGEEECVVCVYTCLTAPLLPSESEHPGGLRYLTHEGHCPARP